MISWKTESDTLRIVDDAGESAYLLVDEPEPRQVDEPPAPVDDARYLDTGQLTVPFFVEIWVREPDGTLESDWSDGDRLVAEAPALVEVGGLQPKTYLYVQDGVAVLTNEGDAVELSFSDGVTVAARSSSDQPAHTITTTTDPTDLMAAISTFGTGLETLSCERSFPTLRSHPPNLEYGDQLSIPDGLETPETDVAIEIPPTTRAAYAVAPLAYYLGADVRPGEPAVVAGDSRFSLGPSRDLPSRASRTLEKLFTLDCLARTEGWYEVELHERQLVEDALPLSLSRFYDLPLSERVREGMTVDYETVEPAIPRWQTNADVQPGPETVDLLPSLANDLATIRILDSVAADGGTTVARSPDIISTPSTDAWQHLHAGPGVPSGAACISEPQTAGQVEDADDWLRVALVVADDTDHAEANAIDRWRERQWMRTKTECHRGITTESLRDVFASDVDFVHYIGHVDDDGIHCSDGCLDTRSLDDVVADAFLLNACTSYDQARGLVDAGAVSGIGTVSPVDGLVATDIGLTAAKTLSLGHTLLEAQSIVQRAHPGAAEYLVLGDGRYRVCATDGMVPLIGTVRKAGDEWSLSLEALPRPSLGTLCAPADIGGDRRYLNSGDLGTWCLSTDALLDYLTTIQIPVFVGDPPSLVWSHRMEPADLSSD